MLGFVELDGRVFALKELGDRLAAREYRLLRAMAAEDLPVVEVAGMEALVLIFRRSVVSGLTSGAVKG